MMVSGAEKLQGSFFLYETVLVNLRGSLADFADKRVAAVYF